MKKITAVVLACLMLLACASAPVFAASGSRTQITSPYGAEVARTTKTYTKDGLRIRTLGRINTVDFEGTFQYGFPWDYTQDGTFHGVQSDSNVKFLHNQTYSAPYGADDNFQGLGLPYSGTDYELYLILPKGEQDPQAAWNKYTKKQKETFLENITSKAMASVTIPRMHLQDTNMVGGYQQTVRLNVDERGTEPDKERIPIERPYCMIPPRIRLTFHANRPFYLLLRNNKTGKVIYEGAVRQL